MKKQQDQSLPRKQQDQNIEGWQKLSVEELSKVVGGQYRQSPSKVGPNGKLLK